ncbi:MAG: glycosyltransferase family 4 protein [Thalassobaculaceae bacterium]
MAALRLGLISPLWPPRGGGGEIYLQRIGTALAALGVPVAACVGVAQPDPAAGVEIAAASLDVDPDDPQACARWFPEIERWLDAWRPTHVLVNAPFSRVSHGHAEPVYAMARRQGCRTGAVHLDLDRGVVEGLAEAYAATGDWDRAAEEGERRLAALADAACAAIFAEIGSPLVFDCDFILSCSAWSDRFVDPLGGVPRVVLHPPIGNSMAGDTSARMSLVDFGFVNPRPHKGGRSLAEIVRRAPESWRFRALEGGHGGAFEGFARDIRGAETRIELIRRVEDMRGFYDGIGALLMASLYEGYGMVAVEAMIRGTPVVARDYPAIREAVGDGAAIVPFDATADEWIEMMAAVRGNPSRWRAAAARRTAEIADREVSEIQHFRAFLAEV